LPRSPARSDRPDLLGRAVRSASGDIVLGRAVADDPAVQPLLAGVKNHEESVALKGFSEPIGFCD
jgi:hypothetical protein